MGPRSTASIKLAFAVLAAIFGLQVYQAVTRSLSSTEAYDYDRFVRPTVRQVMAQELPNREVLYTLLEKRSVGLFHVSPFSVRLPSLLFAILYLWSVWRMARLLLGSGWLFLVAVTAASLLPLWWDCFVLARGFGAALALQVCAAQFAIRYLKGDGEGRGLNLAGACLGLSVAACLDFAIPAAILALLSLGYLAVQRCWSLWIDRILVPALIAALVLLVMPLSHAHASAPWHSDLTLTESAQLRSALEELRSDAGIRHVRIGASPVLQPNLNFFRDQYRMTNWDRAGSDLACEDCDYYLLANSGAGLIGQRHLIVLHRDGDFVVAHRSHDGM
jgi:hypothetical protein